MTSGYCDTNVYDHIDKGDIPAEGVAAAREIVQTSRAAVAADRHVHAGFESALKNPVVWLVLGHDADGSRPHEPSELPNEVRGLAGLLGGPVELPMQDPFDLTEDGRRGEELDHAGSGNPVIATAGMRLRAFTLGARAGG